MPKVSVLTPIYKTNPEHLRGCIESILSQTFTDFEFLILNDSSGEKYLDDIVRSYKDKRIKYIKNKTNVGISAARNKLLELASGQYIAIFDHDDISMPTRLAKQVEYLDTNPDVGVCSCWVNFFLQNRIQKMPIDNLDIKQHLTQDCFVSHSGAMIRKSVLDKNYIRYESEYSPCEDYMLWVRLINKTMFHNIPEPLLKYRKFDNNTSAIQSEKMQDRAELIRNIACATYPHLHTLMARKPVYRWGILFHCIPIVRISHGRNAKLKFYLFGFIPLFSLKRDAHV